MPGHDEDELARGWKAIDEGAALITGISPALLVATGEERAEFLHGQTSNDVRGLGAGAGCAALALTAQGRPVAMFALYNDAERERILIATTTGERDGVRAALERFLVADDCEFEDAPDLPARVLAGPTSAHVLDHAGVKGLAAGPHWSMTRGTVAGQGVLVLARGDLRVPVFEIFAVDDDDRPTDDEAVWTALASAGAASATPAALEIVRVESGTARFGKDVDDSRIAVEARLEWAIHFGKGCYVGQEVVERAVSRGRIQHLLCLLAAPDAVEGDRVAGGAERDVATSVVTSPRLGRLALAYLPADSAEPGTSLTLESPSGTSAATVLPWPRTRVLAGRSGAA